MERPTATAPTQSTLTSVKSSPLSSADYHDLIFKTCPNEQGKARVKMSLQNISGRALYYRIKKQKDAKIRIQPVRFSDGRIEPHSGKEVTIAWDFDDDDAPSAPTPLVKLLVELSLNPRDFDGPRSAQTRLIGRVIHHEQFTFEQHPYVLLMDAPAGGLPSFSAIGTALRSIATESSTTLRSIASRSRVSGGTEEEERQRFSRWLLFYLIIVIVVGILFKIYQRDKRQQQELAELANRQILCRGYTGV